MSRFCYWMLMDVILSRNRKLIWKCIAGWALLPPWFVIKRRYYSIRNGSPLKEGTRFSVSNEGTTKQRQIWMFEKKKWTYTKGKLCLNSRRHIFQSNPVFCFGPIWKKSLLRHIGISISWSDSACCCEWNPAFNLSALFCF